jgi:hypothetical protein
MPNETPSSQILPTWHSLFSESSAMIDRKIHSEKTFLLTSAEILHFDRSDQFPGSSAKIYNSRTPCGVSCGNVSESTALLMDSAQPKLQVREIDRIEDL